MNAVSIPSKQRAYISACVAVVMTAWMMFNADAAMAQSLSLGGVKGDVPIEVNAEYGIEWQQDRSLFLARGKARGVGGGGEGGEGGGAVGRGCAGVGATVAGGWPVAGCMRATSAGMTHIGWRLEATSSTTCPMSL